MAHMGWREVEGRGREEKSGSESGEAMVEEKEGQKEAAAKFRGCMGEVAVAVIRECRDDPFGAIPQGSCF
jgi:hypothetical protein